MRISLPAVPASSSKTKNRNVMLALVAGSFVVVGLTWLQDYVRAYLKESAYYFSESLLFSTFWWFFVPVLFAQYKAVKVIQSIRMLALLMSGSALIHAFCFPFLVWTLSRVFYAHTFGFQPVLRYTIAEHGYQLVLLYTIPLLTYRLLNRQEAGAVAPDTKGQKEQSGIFIDKILVSSGGKKQAVFVRDILYVSSATPYVSLHMADRKYLHTETLKSLAGQLDPTVFVRIHKSTIVNVSAVLSYTSRLNGDYDLSLKNGVMLRISRNFASSFRQRFESTHPVRT